MAPVFQIQIDDPQEFHVGGDALTGKLLLVVSGSHALSLKDMVLRVICDVETSIEAQVDPSSKTKLLKGSMRLYDGEMSLPLPSKHFPPGRHEIPFKFQLPSDRPRLPPTATDVQQPTTYGHINYRLKAHARKGASSWFSSGEIKTAESFMFMPPSTLTDEHMNAPAIRQHVMSGYVGGAASDAAQSDSFWSRLTGSGSKRRKEPPLEVQCYLNEPTIGLTQDRPTPFQLRIVSSSPQEPIMVQSVSLILETVVTLVANGTRISNRRASQPLVQAKVLRSGVEVDVSDLVNAVSIRSRVLPTFQTPLMTFNYALVVQVALVRAHHHRGESANIVQRLPIRVLSPFIIGEHASATTPAHSDAKPEIKSQSDNIPEKSGLVAPDPQFTKPRPVRKPVNGSIITPTAAKTGSNISKTEKPHKLEVPSSPPGASASAADAPTSRIYTTPDTAGTAGTAERPATFTGSATPEVAGISGYAGSAGIMTPVSAFAEPVATSAQPMQTSTQNGSHEHAPASIYEQHPSEPPPAYHE